MPLRVYRHRSIAECHLRGLLILLFLVLPPCIRSSFAIDPHRTLTQALVRKWQFSQGLPQPSIFTICQTQDGHLWLGTQAGLYQFDGVRFSAANVKSGPRLDKLWIQHLVEDSRQRLWLATSGAGLLEMQKGVTREYGLAEGLPSLNIQRLLVDRNGDLWIGTDQGLALLRSGQITTFEKHSDLTIQNVTALCETPSGTICIGGEQGHLNLYRDGEFLTRHLSTIPSDTPIRALLATPAGDVYVGTTVGLVVLDENGESRITRNAGLADDVVETLALARNGQIWVGTRDGLSRLGDKETESFRTRDGLTQSTVFSICEDHEGNVWVGTKNGLNQFVDRRTIPITTSEGLPSNDIGPILQDRAGTIWIGTLDAGLARYVGPRCELVANTSSGLPGNRITSLAEGTAGELWIGTDQGLCRLVNGHVQEQFGTEHGLPSDHILVLLQDETNTLWIGTSKGLAQRVDSQFRIYAPESELAQWPVRKLLLDPKRGMIAATEGGGLFRCVESNTLPMLSNSTGVQNVTTLTQGRENVLWAGTRGDGLCMLRENQVTRFTLRNGLYDDEIYGLTTDPQGRLWMACSRGIFFVDEQELFQVAAGKLDRVSSTFFSPLESQRTVECQQGVDPSIWKMNDGRIWFATIHGILILGGNQLQRNLPTPAVTIEQMQMNGRIVDTAKPLQFSANENNLMFRYSAMSFASPNRIQFRYHLEGYDENWVDAGLRREAYYTNLPPGHYRFSVSARNPGNEWAVSTFPATFTIRQYFYKSWWFICLCTILLGALVWGMLRLRVLQVRSQLNAALAERMRIARDLHDTLIQGFSGVTMQMQALAARLKDPTEKQRLIEVITDAGNCLREARQTVSGLRHSRENASGLIESITQTAINLTETQDIQLKLVMPASLPPLPDDVEYNLLRIAQEAIANVIKHAHANVIQVQLKYDGNQISLSIIDDGQGFNCNESHPPAGHYGLIGIRERAHQIQAEVRIESLKGCGTIVELVLARIPAGSSSMPSAQPAIPEMQRRESP